jgi:hypothetical protein
MSLTPRTTLLIAAATLAFAACNRAPATATADANQAAGNDAAADANAVYATYGVHNPPAASHGECANANCVYARGPGEPADPQYPPYWQSHWTMYRVFNNYATNLPPYNGRPPAPLVPGRDYQISYGATYYDSTWRGPSGEGAMMEHYDHYCLPIFPIPNNYTCSFISLGDTAYFLTYEQDRPAGMPPVCLFSPLNHPPRRDFVSHLPYAAGDSRQLGAGAQAYSFWVSAINGQPMQTGASPDQTGNAGILFGYAFAPVHGQLQPSSFYFSGYPMPPANAPIVSQNYTDWAPTRPDPAQTWNQVAGLDPATLPPCQLFDPPANTHMLGATAARAPTWGHIGRWRPRR